MKAFGAWREDLGEGFGWLFYDNNIYLVGYAMGVGLFRELIWWGGGRLWQEVLCSLGLLGGVGGFIWGWGSSGLDGLKQGPGSWVRAVGTGWLLREGQRA